MYRNNILKRPRRHRLNHLSLRLHSYCQLHAAAVADLLADCTSYTCIDRCMHTQMELHILASSGSRRRHLCTCLRIRVHICHTCADDMVVECQGAGMKSQCQCKGNNKRFVCVR